VHHAMALLRDEIHRDMALLGINTLAEMTRERIRGQSPNYQSVG
jgi:isopentenyl diphosphate isomerase/L-lactate dehydrogenase-like FMN-dependent dehydrogenase